MKQEARVILLPTKNNIKGAICQGVDRQLYPNAAHPENKMYGNFLLSSKRDVSNNLVTHADLENWKELNTEK